MHIDPNGIAPCTVALEREVETYELYRAHAYVRREELLGKNIAPRLENLRAKFVSRADRDIWEFENWIDTLNAQIEARKAK